MVSLFQTSFEVSQGIRQEVFWTPSLLWPHHGPWDESGEHLSPFGHVFPLPKLGTFPRRPCTGDLDLAQLPHL